MCQQVVVVQRDVRFCAIKVYNKNRLCEMDFFYKIKDLKEPHSSKLQASSL
jgi:hypothetical protein